MNETKLTVPTRWVLDEGDVFTFWGDKNVPLQHGDEIQISLFASVPYGTAKIIRADNTTREYMAQRVA